MLGSCIEYTTAKPPLPSGRPRTYDRFFWSPVFSSLYVSTTTRGHFTSFGRSLFNAGGREKRTNGASRTRGIAARRWRRAGGDVVSDGRPASRRRREEGVGIDGNDVATAFDGRRGARDGERRARGRRATARGSKRASVRPSNAVGDGSGGGRRARTVSSSPRARARRSRRQPSSSSPARRSLGPSSSRAARRRPARPSRARARSRHDFSAQLSRRVSDPRRPRRDATTTAAAVPAALARVSRSRQSLRALGKGDACDRFARGGDARAGRSAGASDAPRGVPRATADGVYDNRRDRRARKTRNPNGRLISQQNVLKVEESVIASVADPPPPHAATAGSGGGGSFTLGSLSIPKLGRLSGGPGRVTPRVSSSAFHGEPTPPRRAESSRPPPAFVLIGRGKTRVSYKYF